MELKINRLEDLEDAYRLFEPSDHNKCNPLSHIPEKELIILFFLKKVIYLY